MDNATVASVLNEIGTLLELKGENPFKCRAYYQGARVIESLAEDIRDVVQQERLNELEGIGEALSSKIQILVQNGSLPYHQELKASLPSGLLELLRIPGLGPKKVKALYQELGVQDISSLRTACEDGRVAGLTGFGKKTAANILQGLDQVQKYQAQHLYVEALGLAQEIVEALTKLHCVTRVELAGSLRRKKEVIKDIDILASATDWKPVMDCFCALPLVERVVNHGETKSSVLLKGGIACDLRVVSDEDFASALHHFTGSKEHNVVMRQRAIERGLKLSEWGLTRGEEKLSCVSEEALFKHLGMSFVPPELRENLGEIEAGERGVLPTLIRPESLRGCFHNHTYASDGVHSIEVMALSAEQMGWEYLGIADHSKTSVQANGLSEDRLLQQIDAIRAYNAKAPSCHLFAGVECDILKNGKLDFSDDILAQLDYVVISVHQHFSMNEEEMTKRIIRAMENPYATMLGHLTGRLLLKREPYAVNIPKIIDAAVATGTWIELNANPQRLDMDWRWWRVAQEKGVLCVINPDAHRADSLSDVIYGVGIARKGWLTAEDVVNTRSRVQVIKFLNHKTPRASLKC